LFNLDDRQTDLDDASRTLFRREGIQLFLPYWVVAAALSVLWHITLLLLLIFLPRLMPDRSATVAEIEQRMAEARARAAEQQRFVFVQPRAEFDARRPPQTPNLSDRDRNAMTPERPPDPRNSMPFSRGNTSEYVDSPRPRETPQPQPQPQAQPQEAAPPSPDTGNGDGSPGSPAPEVRDAIRRGMTAPNGQPSDAMGNAGLGERLGNALRNVQRYYGPNEVFENAQGGGQFGEALQFDTKGVEFGPWVRRFIAQIRRNWVIPYAAMSLRGHVVVTFNVHKDGRITDVSVAAPSGVDGFNNSSFNAIAASNPTQPLPPEYPADKAFFTITFYYNETPPR
jgi:TonB family protein